MKHPLDDVLAGLFPSGTLFAVGGRVRDEFRARAGQRIDARGTDLDYVVTGLALPDLLASLRSAGRVNVVGASFSVVKFEHDAGAADIALPRRERSTGSGHRDFAIESGPAVPLADDLGRRDFTINMIARQIGTDAIVDPFGGVRDIAAQRIDIVGPQTFRDDPLRMLRAAQFAARFRYTLSSEATEAMTANANLAATISADRVGDELTKLFERAPLPSVGLEVLRTTGVLAVIWPELLEGDGVEQNQWHAYDVYRHGLATVDAAPESDVTLRLAAILHDVGKPRTKDGPHFYRHETVGAEMAAAMLQRVRYSGERVETVRHLVRHHMYSADPDLPDRAIRRYIHRIGREHLDRLFALRAADIAGSGLAKRDDSNERFQQRVYDVLAAAPPFTVRDLAVDGIDVMRLLERAGKAPAGFRGDARVGSILRDLFEFVTDEPAANERTTLLHEAERRILDLP